MPLHDLRGLPDFVHPTNIFTHKKYLSGLKTNLASLSILTISLMLAACNHSAPTAAGGPPIEIGYSVVTTQKVALDTELPGRVSAYLVADVRPQVSGIIQSRLFKEGADVKASQVLYQIDPALLQAAFDNTQATLAKDEANQISVKLKADRYKELLAIHGVSQQDYDDADAAAKQGDATIAADKASLETNRINLQYARITSPISGRIGISTVTPGALVTADQTTALSTIQQLDPIYVDITQSSTALLKLRRQLESGKLQADQQQQATVKLQLDDGSNYALEGKLQFSDITVDQTTSSVTLRAVFPNPKHELLPGMYVKAQLQEGTNNEAILVPQGAVTRDTTGAATVTLLNAQGKLEPRRIDAQKVIGSNWLVGSGLQKGDRVVVEGLTKLRPGMPFKAVEITTKPASSNSPGNNNPGANNAPAQGKAQQQALQKNSLVIASNGS